MCGTDTEINIISRIAEKLGCFSCQEQWGSSVEKQNKRLMLNMYFYSLPLNDAFSSNFDYGIFFFFESCKTVSLPLMVIISFNKKIKRSSKKSNYTDTHLKSF